MARVKPNISSFLPLHVLLPLLVADKNHFAATQLGRERDKAKTQKLVHGLFT